MLPVLIEFDERPMPGLAEFLVTASRDFRIEIYGRQSDELNGRAALRGLLGRHLLAHFRALQPQGAERRASEIMRRLHLPYGAPEHIVFCVKQPPLPGSTGADRDL